MTTPPTITIGHDEDGNSVDIDPSAIISTRLMVQADSRQGKTSLLRLIAEGLLSNDRQVIVLDVEGEFATLRDVGDVLVLGGDYGEAPIVPAAASKIAELLASTTTSAVLDLLSMDPDERDQFVADLLEWWVRMPQKYWRPSMPRTLLIDEAQELAPQAGKSDSRPVVDKAMRLLAKRGFAVVPATQRLSSTSKGVVNVCRSNAVGPIAPKDAKDAADVLGIESRQRHDLVRQEVGTFTVRGAVFGVTEAVQVQVDRPRTSAPDPGDAPVSKARKGTLGKLIKSMQSLKTKADKGEPDTETMEGLQQKVKDLQADLAAKPEPVVDTAAIDRAVVEAVTAAVIERDQFWRDGLIFAVEDLHGKRIMGTVPPPADTAKPNGMDVIHTHTKPPRETAPPPEGFTTTGPQQRILDALAWWESIGVTDPGNDRIGIIAGIKAGVGHWTNTVGPLSTSGLVNRGRGSTTLTPAGRSLARRHASQTTLAAYHDAIRRQFKGRTLDMLNAFIGFGPRTVSNEVLADAVGIKAGVGHFNNTIGPLSSFGLIDRNRGDNTPTPLLYPEDLR